MIVLEILYFLISTACALALGNIVFEVSSRKVRTFRDLKRTHKARFATHNLIGNKPMLEYIGPDVAEITFTMQLSASLGINPTAEAACL